MPPVSREFTALPPDPGLPSIPAEPPYAAAREQLRLFLTQYALIDSYHKFGRARTPYPFVAPQSLKPGSVTGTKEYDRHNNALVILLNGAYPRRLRKHFRCRDGNRVRKKNIASVAPNLPGLERYDRTAKALDDPEFPNLMRMLLALDYGLLIQRPEEPENSPDGFELTHFHVKIERLTDNALRDLGMHLNYLEKRLDEQGDEFVDQLERKFFEYYNFYHNAAGRKSAAALAAQLLLRDRLQGTVFVASQQDRRLTLLTVDGPDLTTIIQQYVLVRLEKEELDSLKRWGRAVGLNISQDYLVTHRSNHGVAVLGVRYEHTAAAKPSPDGRRKEALNIREKWLKLVDESLVPITADQTTRIHFPVAYRRCSLEEHPEGAPHPLPPQED